MQDRREFLDLLLKSCLFAGLLTISSCAVGGERVEYGVGEGGGEEYEGGGSPEEGLGPEDEFEGFGGEEEGEGGEEGGGGDEDDEGDDHDGDDPH